jgi:hypothetical protein
MSSEPPVGRKEDQGLSSAEPGRVLQNPQPPRNKEQAPPTKAEQEAVPPILRPRVTGASEVRRDVKTVLGKE